MPATATTVATTAQAAFERLVADHHARACAVAYTVLRDRARSEEIAQDAVLLAWERRDQIPLHASAWLCTIARNLARNAVRRVRPQSLDRDVAGAGDPLHSMLEAEEQRLAGEALAELPDEEREAIVLFYRCGESVHAIADAAGITEVAARKRLQRGRDHLRERVGGVERRLTRTRPAAAVAAGCIAAWLLRSGAAQAAGAAAASARLAGHAKLVGLVVATTALGAGAVMLARAVEPPAQAATIAPAAAAVAAPPAARPSAPALADAAAAPVPSAPTPTLPPIDPRYADAPFHASLFTHPGDVKLPAWSALELVSGNAAMPIYVDGVDPSQVIDLSDLHGDTVGEVFDQLLDKLHATRTEVPGIRTSTLDDHPTPCAAGFGGDRVDADFVDALELRAASDLIQEHLRVPMFVSQKAWPITVKLHGTAGEAFDQLAAAAHMGCTVEPGYVITPKP